MPRFLPTLVTLLALALCRAAPAAGPITVGVYDNPPLVTVDERGRPSGLYVDLLEHVARREQWSLRYVTGSWSEIYGRLERGEIDLLAAIAHTEERAGRLHFNREAVATNWGLLVKLPGGEVDSLLDLQGRRVAVLRRDVHTRALENLLERFSIDFEPVPAASYSEVVDLVEGGNADAGVVNRLYSIRVGGSRRVVSSGVVFNPVEVRYASPAGAGRALVDAIDRHLVALKAREGSAYYEALGRWLEAKAAARLPRWVLWLGIGGLVGLAAAGVHLLVLRRQVHERTAALTEQSRSLEQEIALRKTSEGRLRGFVDASPDLLFVVDEACVFLDVMTSSRHLLLLDPSEFLGRRVQEVLPPALAARTAGAIARALDDREMQEFEYSLDMAGGTHWFEARIVPVGQRVDGRRTALMVVGDVSERKMAGEALRDSEARFKTLARVAPVGIVLTDCAGRCRFVNERWCEWSGLTPAECVEGGWMRALHPDDLSTVEEHWREALHEQDELALEFRVARPDGVVWVSMRAVPLRDEEHGVSGWIAALADITGLKDAAQRLQQSAVFFQSTTEGLVVTDARGTISAVNHAFTTITGFSEDEVLGKDPLLLRSDHHDQAFYHAMRRAVREVGQWQGELWIGTRSGEAAPQWLTVSAVRDAAGAVLNYVAAFSDIRALKESEARLARLAHQDPLTDLPNRLLLNEQLHRAIRGAQRAGHGLAVLFLDLDRFKNINDSLGHPVGDQVLRVIAERLRDGVREIDIVARLGGDEFVVVMEQVRSRADVERMAEKLIERIHHGLRVAGHDLFLTTSIGISLYPGDGADVATLVRNADAAMYQAKNQGRNTHCFYTRELTDGALRRAVFETGLRRALEREELVLYYQPQFDLGSGELVGAEALVRWQHPDEGLLPPGRFLELAEECGLMGRIGEWVLRTACRQARAWQERGLGIGTLAVNLSGHDIGREDLVGYVEAVLAETGCPPERLELELTEGIIMQRAEETVRTLEGLRGLGVSLAVDDFGTGYSSLSYLKRFPIRTLKIDRSFVRDIPEDPNDEAIAAAILALARSLGLRVVGEGIETEAQRTFLREAGCELGQGFLLGRPVPAGELERLLGAADAGDAPASTAAGAG